MIARLATVPCEIVDCIAHAREPSAQELWRVAGHIRRDFGDSVPGTRFDVPHVDDVSRLSLRAARAALAGCC